MLAPIVLFVYNRPAHTRRVIEALKNNELARKSELFIFSDAPSKKLHEKRVEQVREYLKEINGFKDIYIEEYDKNKGCDKSILYGVNKILEKYSTIIVLEDDHITSPNFLTFMNKALKLYQDYPEIWSITGYGYPVDIPKTHSMDVYLLPRSVSSTWATWKDRWIQCDWELKDISNFFNDRKQIKKFSESGNDLPRNLKHMFKAWDIRYTYNQFINNAYTLVPVKSKVQNIGFDNTGVHCKKDTKFDVLLDDGKIPTKFPKKPQMNRAICKNIKKLFDIDKRVLIREWFISTLLKEQGL